MMKILIPILLIISLYWNASAKERYCTKPDAIEAENSVSRLNNWEDIYKSFKRFRHCDDGAIAEGYSDSVVRMFADQWEGIETLINLTSSDQDFYTFVLRHIDATADKSEIEKIIANSSKHCPESAKAMCSAIEDAARKALRDIKE
jgi:hypothetical protein